MAVTAIAGLAVIAALAVPGVGALMPSVAYADIANPITVDADLNAAREAPKPSSYTTPLVLPDAGKIPDDADSISFMFKSLDLVGAHAIPPTDLRRLWTVEAGAVITVADVFAFADAITAAYRNAGYALSFAVVPAQSIESGNFRIQIVEGRLEGLAITGPRISKLVRDRIADAFSVIEPGQPTLISELERFLLLVNDIPGVTARGTVSPGSSRQTSMLTLEVTQQRFDAAVSYNNFLSESLGRDVSIIDLKAFNQWTGRDALSISLKSAPDIAVYRSSSIDYQTYVNDNGLQLLAAASESMTAPKKGSLAAIDFSSVSYSNSVGFRMPWKRSRNSNIFVGGNFATSHTKSMNGVDITSEDKLRTVSVYAEYDVSHASGATSGITGTMTTGLTLLGARGDSRANADPSFSTYQIKARHERPILTSQNGALVGSIDLKTQLINSDKPLLANAECSFGGRQYGVGFDAGVLSGETCLMGTMRLTWRQNVRSGTNAFIGQALYYLRYDKGRVRQKGPLNAGEPRQVTASSYGVGTQLVFRNGLAFLLEASEQQKRSDVAQVREKFRTHASLHFGL